MQASDLIGTPRVGMQASNLISTPRVGMQAFDLNELREVAVKIHQLHSSWNEAKKASYVRHALREYSIHRGLAHARIVALLDIFEIDANTFATVLELCTGGDLDTHLKEHQVGCCASGQLPASTDPLEKGNLRVDQATCHLRIRYQLSSQLCDSSKGQEYSKHCSIMSHSAIMQKFPSTLPA